MSYFFYDSELEQYPLQSLLFVLMIRVLVELRSEVIS